MFSLDSVILKAGFIAFVFAIGSTLLPRYFPAAWDVGVLSNWNGSFYATRVEAADGFTPIEESIDTTVFYVSNAGNDSNDCTSSITPCLTIQTAIDKMTQGVPDHLLLRAGDTFTGSITNITSGRSTSEPVVVSSYGAGARPILHVFSWTLGGGGIVKNFVNIIGLHFSNNITPSHASVGFFADHTNILMEDNYFDRAEVIIQSANADAFSLRRNIFTGAYYDESSLNRDARPSNVFASGVEGLNLEENVLDSGGWDPSITNAGANQFNHNVYIQYDTDPQRNFFRGNIYTRGSSHGIQMRGGGIANNNFSGRNAIGWLFGSNLGPGFMPNDTVCGLNNVVSEGSSMIKGDNPCQNLLDQLCTGSVAGQHYSLREPLAKYRMYNNIVAGRSPDDDAGDWLPVPFVTSIGYQSVGLFNDDGNSPPSVVEQAANETYHFETLTEGDGAGYPDPDRTLGTYYTLLDGQGDVPGSPVGVNNFEKFMYVLINRQARTWDENFTAYNINDYFRAGFGISTATEAVCN
jgi:hypothetical protein